MSCSPLVQETLKSTKCTLIRYHVASEACFYSSSLSITAIRRWVVIFLGGDSSSDSIPFRLRLPPNSLVFCFGSCMDINKLILWLCNATNQPNKTIYWTYESWIQEKTSHKRHSLPGKSSDN